MSTRKNATNSPVIQAILDAIDVAVDSKDKETETLLRSALKKLQQNKQLLYKADAKYNSHRYPERVITYTKVATYNQCPERFALSHGAQAVLSLFASIASQDGLITIPQSDLASILHTNRQQLRRYIDELCQYQYIAIYDRPPRGTRKPITYLLDRRIVRTGKDPNDTEITNFNAMATGARQNLDDIPAYEQATLTQKSSDDNKIIRIGTVIPSHHKEKEPASAVTPPQMQAQNIKTSIDNTITTINRSNDDGSNDEYITIPPDIDFL